MLLVTLLVLPCVLAAPQTEVVEGILEGGLEENSEVSWFSMFSQLAGVAIRASEAVADVVKKEGALEESFGGNYTQVVQDSVQELLQLVPQIKSNISAAIAMVPEVQSKLTERLSGLPTTEELQQSADSLFAKLPNYTMVSELGSSVREGLASLPTREEMVQGVQSAFDLIPEAEEVHSNIDTAVNAISPIFDRENELAASAA